MNNTNLSQFQLSNALYNPAYHIHTYNDIKSCILVYVMQLYDNNYIALFSRHNVNISKNRKVTVKGPQDPSKRLWTISLSPTAETSIKPPTRAALGVIQDFCIKQ